MDFFRALVAKGEKSERVVELTGELVKLNPGHYSVWCVFPLANARRLGMTPKSCLSGRIGQ
jgi:hypothetical protein